MKSNRNLSSVWGAAFLMATSAVGPGFLTQTTVFTHQLGASFGFVIITSIFLDLGVQLNIWRIIAIARQRAPAIADQVVPGLGKIISGLVVLGGLAFNLGNIAGATLGFQVLLGLTVPAGAFLAASMAISLFLVKKAGHLLDRFTQLMGLLLILLIVYVAFAAAPPMAEAATKTFFPDQIDVIAIVTLVGGTVGGYITFAGGHRLLDAGLSGEKALPLVQKSALSGIIVASVIRVFLFLAAWGVVAQGLPLSADNPPAAVFRFAAGQVGYKLFGVVMLAAAVTSIIGAAYTSVSFLKAGPPFISRYENKIIIGFIALAAGLFITIGQPVRLLLLAGALNGLILPLALGTLLIAAHQRHIIGVYRHPRWLTFFGWLVVGLMTWMGGYTLVTYFGKLF